MDRAITAWRLVALGAACAIATGCATGPRAAATPAPPPTTARTTPDAGAPRPPRTTTLSPAVPLTGKASWYGEPHHGQKTASGEVYDMHKLTAAHRTLQFGTRLKVTHVDTGRTVVVRVNDRGPHVPDRIVDLSHAAAVALGVRAVGVFAVRLEVLDEAATDAPQTPSR